ncbi:thiamine-phosphate kinase [Pseudomonas typographi]|uniref:thiamine-phosphate kinase n=1 Tax=Pseudomonas typographi TaxID=2715964 RepID=UPI001685FC3B|nr:thiamine-phosphate kinase [Pseudomonas typographi]MBD1588399.1 thiamine-phosphate kinase [Pseudomonas typographi]
MGEFELISRYFAAAPCAQAGDGVALGIGDDCALLALAPGEQLAVSTDTLVSGVHFPAVPDPFLLGQRSLAVAVSDLAAMGAQPLGFTLALTLPDFSAQWLGRYAEGLQQMAQRCAIRLVGGDTTRGPLSLTLTVLGKVPGGQALTRGGARPGELFCVGGVLGEAAGALPLVLGERSERSAAPGVAGPLLAHYWAPQPQLALGQALRGRASAAIDISDGLLADAGHIAEASGVAVHIERSRLPLSDALVAFAGEQGAFDAALAGGDDYVLAFSLPAQHVQALQLAGQPVHVIGQVHAGHGVTLLSDDGRDITPAKRGYQHFRGPM